MEIIDKGFLNGTCNMSSCTTGEKATWYNHGNSKYYCSSCASRLNSDEFNQRDAMRLFGHELCIDVEDEEGIIYDEWIPYDIEVGYEKNECDIKLKSGKIIKHLYPNAGRFHECCTDEGYEYQEKDVAEVMYRQYYMEDICSKNGHNCNGREKKAKVSESALFHEVVTGEELLSKSYDEKYTNTSSLFKNRYTYIRDTPKINRNSLCPCGSGKKYKKCCINKK